MVLNLTFAIGHIYAPTQNTFVIEYGLSVGSTEVITSSGKIVASAFSN